MNNKKGLAMPLHLACAKEGHHSLEYIHFINGYAYASNGHVLIKQSIDYLNIINKECLNGKAIHKDLFKDLCKLTTAEATETAIYAKDMVFPYKEVKTPDFERIMPKEQINLNKIKLNPNYIDIISKCLYRESYEDYLIFDFYDNYKSIITVKDSTEQMAIIMSII
jgi:hypothetical protein